MERLSRRSFMKIAGAATGAAALASAPPIARAAMGEEERPEDRPDEPACPRSRSSRTSATPSAAR